MDMGEVICVYKIMPGSPESADKVRKSLEELEPNRLEEEPVAFGLVSLKFTKIIPDGPGDLEELENKLNNIDGVGSVENIRTSRAM
jgi:translation elongation factor aEF-1 beta